MSKDNKLIRKITMQQIADRLGLSKFAVSAALSGKEGVSKETRHKIIETAKMMGYKVQQRKKKHEQEISVIHPINQKSDEVQSSEEHNKKKYVLIFVHGFSKKNTYWERVIGGISSGCEDYGWNHLVSSIPSQSKAAFTFPDYLDPSVCVGIIFVGTFGSDHLIACKQIGYPLILVDHEDPVADLDCVVNANSDGGQMACRHLVSRGCKRIIFVGSHSFSVSFRERYWGVERAVAEMQAEQSLSLEYWNIGYGVPIWSEELKNTLSNFQASGIPTGFICANDNIASTLLQYLNELNSDVPGQFKVIGFDNNDHAPFTQPPLTTVSLSKEELGYRAVEALARRIKRPGAKTEKIMLTANIIVRGTV